MLSEIYWNVTREFDKSPPQYEKALKILNAPADYIRFIELIAHGHQRGVNLGGESLLSAGDVPRGILQDVVALPQTARILGIKALLQSQILVEQKISHERTMKIEMLTETLQELSREPFLSTKEYFILLQIVQNLRMIGETDLALAVLKDLLTRLEYVRNLLNDSRLSLQLGSTIDRAFQGMTNIYLLQGCDSCPEKALKIREANRARSILALVTGNRLAKSEAPSEASVYERARTALERLRNLGDGRSSSKEMQAAMNFLSLKVGLRQGQQGIGDVYSKASFIPQRLSLPDLSIEKVQQHLDSSTLVIVYSLTEELCGAWLISKEEILWKPLGALNEVQKAIIRYRTELLSMEASWKQRFDKAAKAAYQTLLQPLEPELQGITRLMIIPDRSTFSVPFESLIVSRGPDDGKYLIEKYEVTYQFSFGLLDESANKSRSSNVPSHKVLLMGNPSMESSHTAFEGTHRATLKPLPGTQLEIEKIQKVVGTAEAIILSGEAAQEEALKENISDYNIVHLATHGIVNERYPWESYLAFSQDQQLTLREVADLKLETDLVVLSACDTGRGRLLEGEGVWGLQAGFLAAGSRNVLASLWKVEDQSTAELMVSFYKNLKGRPQKFSTALRAAKLQILKSDNWQHPYYWAPFILYGGVS